MLSLVVTAAYTGTLTSFLSVSTQPLLFSTASDLLTKSHHYTWGTYKDGQLQNILKVVEVSIIKCNKKKTHKILPL